MPVAVVGGALAVLSFAPFGWYPFALLSVLLFYQLVQGRTARGAFLLGWIYGLGLLGVGVFWIRISLNEFGNMHASVAYLVTALFIAGMALYYAIGGWLIRWLGRGGNWIGPLLVLPSVWVLQEWARGWLMTGFPWLALGYGQIDSPLGGYAPVIGVYGISLLVALSAGLIWSVVQRNGMARALSALVLSGLWLGGAGLWRIQWTVPAGQPIKAAVVQANIPQAIKWNEESLLPTLQAYLELTKERFDADIIVWPETALPEFLHRLRDPFIDPLSERAREEGSEIVIGIPVIDLEQDAYYNGLLAIGTEEDLYYKRHLVPFGEFIPFKGILGKVMEIFEVPMSDFTAGSSSRPLLQVGEHQAGVSICYEDVFPAEVIQAMPDAAFLINVSNDAWFGDSLAPHQHLEIARMRALENGRYLLRATNTGISAILDQKGGVLGVVPSFERGGISEMIQPLAGATPFAQAGNWPVIGLAALMLIAAAGLRYRSGA